MNIEKGLLIHWWHYYGKSIYTLAELEEFEKIIDKYGVNKVLDVGVASYIVGDGSPQVILSCIRTNSVEEMFSTLPDFSDSQEELAEYQKVKKAFIDEISSKYNQ